MYVFWSRTPLLEDRRIQLYTKADNSSHPMKPQSPNPHDVAEMSRGSLQLTSHKPRNGAFELRLIHI